ncbi:MAG: ABC transporter permease [Methanotrichaceae archaeon]
MLPNALWQEEIIEECKSRRSLATKLLLALVLVGPLALVSVPAAMRSGGMALAVIFIGIFGSSIGIVGLRESKMLERLAVLPLHPAAVISNYILGRSIFTGIQLALPLALILFAGQVRSISMISISWIILCYIAALISASAIGTIVAIIARSSGEVHLYAFLAVIATAIISGILPGIDSVISSREISPFWQLSNALLFSWGISDLYMPALALVSGAVIPLAALLLSPRLFRSG